MRARAIGEFKATAGGERIDMQAVRDTTHLADVVTRLLGPAPGRRGERSSRRLWWPCPFHEDRNPSFCVKPGGRQWRCWGCGEKGDAIELVRRLNPGWTFPEAVAYLTGQPVSSVSHSKPLKHSRPPSARPWMPTDRPPPGPPGKAADRPRDGPSGLPPADALALVDEAAERLWTPEGRSALAYIKGRGLTEVTIRAARLGWTPRVMLPAADGIRYWRASGVVIPWLDGDRLCLVKIRQPAGREPRYAQAFSDRPSLYPGPGAIRPVEPLVIVEGEFDALLLGQELADLTSVITTGSASSRPEGSTRLAMLRCPRWYAAHDADDAGDRAAAEWPARAIRVRPPAKDWCDARKAGIDLRRWWVEEALADAFDREERAAILEFDGGLTREAAERAAGLKDTVSGDGSSRFRLGGSQ